MTKQDLIHHLKHRIAYSQEEQGRYEAMHKDEGTMHSLWSEMADWHKGRVCAYGVALELLEELDA